MAMILGITPARGGSKSIPKKNIKEICGKPLIAWTIEAAKKSKLLDRYVVSTEDEEIAEIARRYVAEVVLRPPELATDAATTLSVLQDVLKKIDADIVVLLQCTSPVRDDSLIDYCIKRFLETNADSLATGFICKFYEWGTYSARRQDLNIDKDQNFEIDDEFDFRLNEQILKKRINGSKDR
jgi:N-acylneuraminate cytidylyltransferase